MLRTGTSTAGRAEDVPPLSPRAQVVRGSLLMVLLLSLGLLVHLTVLSRLQHSAAQAEVFAKFRSSLALGTAPAGPTDETGRQLKPGTAIALLEAPTIDLRQIVREGTAAGVLFDGPGHRRDSPFPGQAGTSIVMGRRAAYGGPFGRIADLSKGDRITVTTSQGVFEFEVLGVRREGDPTPPPVATGSARLVLATAAGTPFIPEGVLRVDADLVGQSAVGPTPLYSPSTLPSADGAMASDYSTLWALALWIQGLALLSVGVVVSWHRWGRPQTWIVFAPALVLCGLMAAGEATRLLPNLL